MYQTLDGSNPGSAGPKSAPVAGGSPPRPLDGAWQLWERFRAWDQRFAIVVDTTLALGLFLVCSGWFSFSKVSHPDLWFVAGLTLPLILRRRAPIGVFLVIAVVAFAQWSTTAPLVADSALLVALYTVTAECDWLAVVVAALILEIGVILATERWTPIGNYSKSLIFLTGMAAASLFAGVVVRALRSQIDWFAERAARLEFERDQQTFLAAAAERARIAREMHDVVSHNIQVMVTLADAAAVAQRADPAGPPKRCTTCPTRGARRSATCGGCWDSCATAKTPPAPSGRRRGTLTPSRRNRAWRNSKGWRNGCARPG